MSAIWLKSATFPGYGTTGHRSRRYPPIGVVNSYGDLGIAGITTTPATYSRYDLVIVNKLTTSPATLRAAAPNTLILAYINSTQITVNSINGNGSSSGTPSTAGVVVQPAWWLTLAGSLSAGAILVGDTTIVCGWPSGAGGTGLSNVLGDPGTGVAAHDWAATPFPILVTSQDKSVAEVMVVTGVAVSGGNYTLTVSRTLWNSTPQAFNAGSRIAQIAAVPNFANTFYLNVTPFCTKVPLTGGIRWSDYLATYIQGQIAAFPDFDGVFLDSSNSYLNPSINTADADMGNQIDPFGPIPTTASASPSLAANSFKIGGDGPTSGGHVFNTLGQVVGVASGRGVYYGVLNLLRALRNQTTNACQLVCTNGSGYPPWTNGMFHENINTTAFSLPPVFFNQSKLMNAMATGVRDGNIAPVTVINANVWTTSAGAVTGGTSNAYSYSYPLMRQALAIATLTNTYAAYAWSTLFHGSTWVFDEYYNAQGASLANAVLTSDTTLTLATGGGAKFANGNVVRVPHAVKETTGTYITRCEDETMTVTGVAGDVLTVTRANTVKGTQIVGTAVFTDAQWAAGAGWLGQPVAAAVNNVANLGAALDSDSFEAPSAGIVVIGAPGSTAGVPTNWTFTDRASGALTPQAACYLDGTTAQVGTQSVRVDVTSPTQNAGAFTYFNVKLLKSITTTVTGGNAMSVSFWAKANRHQQMSLRILSAASASLFSQTFLLTDQWSQFVMSFIPPSGDTGIKLQFEFSAEDGRYWLDNCQTYSGDINIWYRDFTNGLVVLNGSAYATNDISHGQGATWKLPAVSNTVGGTFTGYKRITGSQDTVNNTGAVETPGTTPSIGIPSLDALFLLKV